MCHVFIISTQIWDKQNKSDASTRTHHQQVYFILDGFLVSFFGYFEDNIS